MQVIVPCELAFNPQAALTERDAMLAVFPLYITVAGLLEVEALEPCGEGQRSKPFDGGDVNAVGGRVTYYEAYLGRGSAHAPKGVPNFGEV